MVILFQKSLFIKFSFFLVKWQNTKKTTLVKVDNKLRKISKVKEMKLLRHCTWPAYKLKLQISENLRKHKRTNRIIKTKLNWKINQLKKHNFKAQIK